MESVTIKVEENLAKEMDEAMKRLYSTKTEFIREAIRDKIKSIKEDSVLEELRSFMGKAGVKTSYAEERRIREEVGKRFAKRYGLKLR